MPSKKGYLFRAGKMAGEPGKTAGSSGCCISNFLRRILDTITLKSLSFSAPHGYYPEEQEKGNRFEVDIIATGNFRASISDNDLTKTFDYEHAAMTAKEIMDGPTEKLIETLCAAIGDKLFENHNSVRELSVSVRKMNPPVAAEAAYSEVTMRWNR
jgi:7,8-dihydroneopterin aldolase/epimerase/oxygenase